MRSKLTLSLLLVVLSASGARAATIFVTRAEDSGAGSLRWAIEEANRIPGHDTIRFRTKGLMTIRPLSELPTLFGPATVDGNTGSPWHEVEIDGSAAGSPLLGLSLAGQGCVVRRLVIHRFSTGVYLHGSDHRVEDSFIGTDSRGESEHGNTYGITIQSQGSIITDNVISGNSVGITISTAGANLIERNNIGPDSRGLNFSASDGASQTTGVFLFQSSDNVLRDNLIAGTNVGLQLDDSSRNAIQGNLFGTDRFGKLRVGDLLVGIRIGQSSHSNLVGGPIAGQGNHFAFIAGEPWTRFGAIVESGVGNTFRGNLFYGMGVWVWPLALVPPANNSQAAPTLGAATSDGLILEAAGTLTAESNREYTIDFYSSGTSSFVDSCESRVYLGSLDVRTDATGVSYFTFVAASGTAPGAFVGATATSLVTGDTSAYSACQEVR